MEAAMAESIALYDQQIKTKEQEIIGESSN